MYAYSLILHQHFGGVIGCRPPQMLQCAADVVSAQCGEEITGYLRTLGSKILEDLGCTTHKRQ